MRKPVRVAVTGAAGQIGYSLLFRIATGEMLGNDQPVILQLLEITPAMKVLEGVAMELEDCAYPLLAGWVLSDDVNKAFKGVYYAMLVGAKPRGPGMERSDLLEANGGIFKVQGKELNDNADRNVKVIVVGNHSTTQWPDISNTTIAGKSAASLVDRGWYENEFIPRVAKRGAKIIAARGASSAASAANGAIDHMHDWVLGTPNDDWTSMVVASDGSYGIPECLMYSFPVTCKNGDYQIVQGLKIDEFSKAKMAATQKELEEERDAVAKILK